MATKTLSKTKQQKQQQQPKAQPSLAQQFNNFTDTTAGLEKTLRLIQALAQIVVEISSHDVVTAARWSTAKSQLALTRRYFRFFNFVECFQKVYRLIGGVHEQGMVMGAIELGKWSALGVYVILEDVTILHAMDIYHVPWYDTVTMEGFKFWFYGLFLSVLGGVWLLLAGNASGAPSKTQMKKIIVDGCDLLIPGSFLGWIGVGNAMVGMAMVLSTVLSGRDLWARAQARTQ